MKLFIKILFSMLITTIYSCNDIIGSEDEEFVMKRKPYNGNELRIDGYYYHSRGVIDGKEWIHIDFFYENGIRLNGYAMKIEDIKRNEEEYRNGVFYDYYSNYKRNWGLFQINGDRINIEVMFAESNGVHKAYMSTGKVLNDTTFHITQFMRSDGSEVENVDFTYHFKKFDGKPDSTNKFIK